MGDRANIFVKSDSEDDHGVYLYTHWRGSELPETLQSALRRGKRRWEDDAYLTRIIFCEMVKDSVTDETGYGISSFLEDGGDRILTVNPSKMTIGYNDARWTFSEYVELTEKELGEIW